MAGTIVGTIAYMAPEQARGDAVDQRADVYAMGLIASDMLLGPRKRPQQTLEDLRRDSDDPPTPLRLIEPSVPEALEAVVLRCLQRHPARRYQTTAELLSALNRLDDKGKKLPAIRRLTPRMVAATARARPDAPCRHFLRHSDLHDAARPAGSGVGRHRRSGQPAPAIPPSTGRSSRC